MPTASCCCSTSWRRPDYRCGAATRTTAGVTWLSSPHPAGWRSTAPRRRANPWKTRSLLTSTRRSGRRSRSCYEGSSTASPRPSRSPRSSRGASLVKALDDHGHALAAADAHRLQPVGLVLFAQAVQERAQNSRAGHPKRVAESDRTAMRVELVAERVDPYSARRRDHLRGESLVDLDDVDVVDGHLRALEGLPRGFNRPQAHELGLERGQSRRDHARHWLNAELLGSALGHDHHRRGTIVERA